MPQAVESMNWLFNFLSRLSEFTQSKPTILWELSDTGINVLLTAEKTVSGSSFEKKMF
jgi:hypothetical protein